MEAWSTESSSMGTAMVDPQCSSQPQDAGPKEGQPLQEPQTAGALAAHVRLLLAQIRGELSAVSAALLLRDRSGQRLRVRWCDPVGPRKQGPHPVSPNCHVAAALSRGTAYSPRAAHRGDRVSCESCRLLFGADAIFAAPLSVRGLPPAVVAAFAPPNEQRHRDFAAARRLVRHLGAFLETREASGTAARLGRELAELKESKLRDLANLTQIAQAIGASLHPATVLQNIVRSTVEAFNSSASAILLLNDEPDVLMIAAVIGLGPAQMGRRVPVEGTASGWVVRHRQTLFVPSVASCQYESLRVWHELEGVRSFVGVPLILQGRAIGTLNLYSRSGQRFEQGDIELLGGLAAQAAIAINHAGLYESVAREKAKLEGIVESLHDGLVLVGPDGAIVYANRRFLALLDLDREPRPPESMRQVWQRLIARCVSPADAGEKLGSLEAGISHSVVLSLGHPYPRDLEVQGFRAGAPDGAPLGRGYLVRDVTQQAEVERLKASILSTVSHELRSPLAAIKGFSSSLLRPDVEWDDASRRDFVEQIDREADRLGVLVRNLLDMSRLDAGTLRLDREWCDLVELVSDLLGRMAPVLSDYRVELAPGAPSVLAFADRRYLERVVWNLLENAAKYSPRGSSIAVGLAREGTHIVLTVADEGVGIAPEDRERIFERFYRGARARTAGVGLGLAICRGIVEAHGGTISVEDRQGEGSVFTVRLPGAMGA